MSEYKFKVCEFNYFASLSSKIRGLWVYIGEVQRRACDRGFKFYYNFEEVAKDYPEFLNSVTVTERLILRGLI